MSHHAEMKSSRVPGGQPGQHPGAGGQVQPGHHGDQDGGGEDEEVGGVGEEGNDEHHSGDDEAQYGEADSG